MSESWTGRVLEVVVGAPGHGGFCVGRHEGRVIFVRHSLPGETVRALVTEDTGGSFCRADAVEIVDASPERIDRLCPIAGPGGSGCCDLSHAGEAGARAWKAAVVSDQLRRIAHVETDVDVETWGERTGWRTRLRLGVGDDGRAGFHRARSAELVTDLACPQSPVAAYDGLADRTWTPGADLAVALDSDDERHVVEIAPPTASPTSRGGARRGASSRRARRSAPRAHRVVVGSGRARQRVADRDWTVDAQGFWQAHRRAPDRYSAVVREWADVRPGDTVWDLYAGAGVFAAAVADDAGSTGSVVGVEASADAVRDGRAALTDLAAVDLRAAPVERALADLPSSPATVILDPPRAGAGKTVVAAVADAGPRRVVHVGCDPASFARDLGLYLRHGYRLEHLRAFDAFPLTSHVECIAALVR
ncbi:class I SAM-dependent RNA methyltransferase [Rhodococcoides corynebacterioides]|uniref:Class I SAM-dependent RNA methyltransferase n=1 Tax=Rhodococcoides corynebacterioides TaxID=53972 RepID=A0ABS7P555_9NOCA|nr:TRAM domain-containing protein [Rhodococcus corynebacterioides]MBY6366321.1 class I SAM-dependent RNA methyltransferase [Rhodococcus corynebacterioides]MBY6406768.1 class I SAM-dependent RNA methyltransferase [Rhodococcus corynebacterioides]